jgi:hypothetical protein
LALIAAVHQEMDRLGIAATLLHYSALNPLSGPFWGTQRLPTVAYPVADQSGAVTTHRRVDVCGSRMRLVRPIDQAGHATFTRLDSAVGGAGGARTGGTDNDTIAIEPPAAYGRNNDA